MGEQMEIFESKEKWNEPAGIVNVASVPQRSPFRYPGGKTWLIPVVRKWLKQENNVECLIEPFAGGAIVSLTAAFEGLAKKVRMAEIDEEIAAVWEVALNGKNRWLAEKILHFELIQENIKAELSKQNKTIQETAFCTILKNRISHGGIIAKGSGIIKNGENGKGIHSRWYPKTLYNRIIALNLVKDKINFTSKDAFEIIDMMKDNPDNYFFIDPPYTVAGKRLYTHYKINHKELFSLVAQIKGKFMLTYDDTKEVRDLAGKYNLLYKSIPMKTTHHLKKNELIISDNLNW